MWPRYLIQQPEKLERLAIIKLGDWVALQAEKLMSPISRSYILEVFQSDPAKAEMLLSRKIEIIRHFLYCNVPSKFHDQLVIEAMRALSQLSNRYEWFTKRIEWLDHTKWKFVNGVDIEWSLFDHPKQSYIIGRMIETLFTKNLTSLSFPANSIKTFGDFFYSKSYMLSGLTKLDLSCEINAFNGINDMAVESNVIQFIKRLHSLKYLSISFATNNILRCVVTNCRLIEELKLYDPDIHDDNVEILKYLPNLNSVHLYDSEIQEEGIKTLLLSCQNIEYITICSDILMSALNDIVSSGEHAGKRFKLKSFEYHDELVPLTKLVLLVQTCPQIQKLQLVKDPDQTPEIMAISDLKDLRELTLVAYDFYADQINILLNIRGYNLVDLVLESLEQIDFGALACIFEMCSNLESLILEDCTFVKQTIVIFGMFRRKLTMPRVSPLKKLKRLAVAASDWEFQPTDEQFQFLLSNCPNVEFVHICYPVLLDDIMVKVLSQNPLICLKQLKIRSNNITRPVIDRIIQNCIGSPEVELLPY